MARADIEWAVDSSGQMYLRDKPAFTRWNTEQLARRAESERQEWLRNNQERS